MAEKIITFTGQDEISSTIDNIKQKTQELNQSVSDQNRRLIEENEKVADSYRKIEETQDERQVQTEVESNPEHEKIKTKINSAQSSIDSFRKGLEDGIFEDINNVNRLIEDELNTIRDLQEKLKGAEKKTESKVPEEKKYTPKTDETEEGKEVQGILDEITKRANLEGAEKKRRKEAGLRTDSFTYGDKNQYSTEDADLQPQWLQERKAKQFEKFREAKESQNTENNNQEPKVDQISQIRENARNLADQLISNARQYSSNSKDVNTHIEEEIRLIEKRNKISFQERALTIENEEDPEKKKTAVLELRSEMKEESLTVELLRELIDTVRQTAKDEIKENRKDVEETLAENGSRVKGLGTDKYGDDKDLALKETIQRGLLGQEKEENKIEEYLKKMTAYQAVSGFVSSGLGSFAQKNEYYGLSQLIPSAIGAVGDAMNYFASSIPIIGNVVGGIVKGIGGAAAPLMGKALSSAEQLESSASLVAQTAPGNWSNYISMGGNAAQYGYDQSRFLQEASQSARSYGNAHDLQNRTTQAIQLEKGLGLGRGEINTTERLSGMTDFNAEKYVDILIKGMRSSGALQGDEIALIPEYLSISNQIAKDQLDRLGSVDIGVNAKMITAMSNMSEKFQNPDVLRGVINSVNQGLIGASTPQMEALQFETLSALNPNASLYQLEEMKEKGSNQPGYLTGMLDRVNQTGFNDEEQMRVVRNMTGLSFGLSREMIQGFKGGKFNEEDWQKQIEEQPDFNFGGKARQTTNRFEEKTAFNTNRFAQAGEKMVDVMDKIVDGMFSILDKVTEMLKTEKTNPFTEANTNLSRYMRSSYMTDEQKGEIRASLTGGGNMSVQAIQDEIEKWERFRLKQRADFMKKNPTYKPSIFDF